ncbi:MAG TPA: transcriptional regulator NrdR [bacterium]|jgi:transcriptional repressor NrdR|nr:transcriptional repressor NrdR [bacterium]MDX9806362.1 transcriptional regulator NrdR [bacterium]HNZ54637.1 transcriptional regulator NrdR [bacterium]HOB71380.1 transcriptional regulator NrdR [bacterium]HOG44500.1 transcriptional regulator NrdR [bacterium]
MKCPFCGSFKDKVIDSRSTKDDSEIRRRRECEDCGGRYTTYERIEEVMPIVKKKNGEREPFDRNKIKKGLLISCQKRPVSAEVIDQIIDTVEKTVQGFEKKEIESSVIGDLVMQQLKKIDKVAFIRFASVYKEFREPTDFITEAKEVHK